MEKQRRALILYATMTKNTEKIAVWFQETFQAYQWDVTMLRLKNNMNIDEIQPQVYFDDYDVICLGSPIVAGYPLKIVSKLFSLGAHSGLEEDDAGQCGKPCKEIFHAAHRRRACTGKGNAQGTQMAALRRARACIPAPFIRASISHWGLCLPPMAADSMAPMNAQLRWKS